MLIIGRGKSSLLIMQIITSDSEIVLPDSFKCPICDNKIYVEEVSEWTRDDDGNWKADRVKIDCVSFPGFDDEDAFKEYMSSHWSMPYADWLPLERIVTDWVNENYNWNLD